MRTGHTNSSPSVQNPIHEQRYTKSYQNAVLSPKTFGRRLRMRHAKTGVFRILGAFDLRASLPERKRDIVSFKERLERIQDSANLLLFTNRRCTASATTITDQPSSDLRAALNERSAFQDWSPQDVLELAEAELLESIRAALQELRNMQGNVT